MAHIEVTWVHEHTFVGVDSTGHSLVLATPGGPGVKPSENLLIALASCSAVDAVDIVKKQRARLEGMQVIVEAEQEAEPPWTFRRIHLRYQVTAADVTIEKVRRAVDLALNRYCSVRASLHPDIVVTFDVELAEPGV